MVAGKELCCAVSCDCRRDDQLIDVDTALVPNGRVVCMSERNVSDCAVLPAQP
jgi:hypothetical protein